jgi:dienelactone hydrolase
MTRAACRAFCAALLLLAILPSGLAGQTRAGPQGPEAGAERRQIWLIPIPGERLLMRATVLRPPGDGPFPLAVINHGSVQSADMRAKFPMPDYPLISRWLLDRGYAVALPQRPGHGETAGPYFEDQGFCEDPDFRQAGLRTADSIGATIDYLTMQPFLRRAGVIVIGQSAGGWGAIALASRNPSAVKAVINFAGGRGGRSDNMPNTNCSPGALIEAAASFGQSERIPTLWLYSESDDYFGPDLSRRMYGAFRDAGGNGEFHLLPSFGAQGHRLIDSGEAFALWAPILERFLAEPPRPRPQ